MHAKVASQGSFTTRIITSPNQDWIPEHPIERTVIRTYANGLWGYHEYSRWAQPLTPNMYHVACIPRPHSASEVPSILWVVLRHETDWLASSTSALKGVGFLKDHIREPLRSAASQAIAAFDTVMGGPDHLRAYGQELRLVLRQCVDSIQRLPTPPGVAIALGAHIQRLSLELFGIRMYLREVLPRMLDGGDHSRLVLPVLGAFVYDEDTALRCARAGLPTWVLQPLTRSIKVWRIVATERPSYVCVERSVPPLEYNPDEIAGVVNASASWLSRMVFAISRQLCSATLPALTDARIMQSKALVMKEAPPPTKAERSVTYKDIRRGGKKRKRPEGDLGAPSGSNLATGRLVACAPDTGAPSATVDHQSGSNRARPDGPPATGQPSREFDENPFYRVPDAWCKALREVGSLPQPTQSVVYFYPPPFLLDGVSSHTPEPCIYWECVVRRDEKIHRYLHNLVRIRPFCRWRLLDPTVSGRPLTIAEWRTVLWGDYHVQPEPPLARTAGGQHRANKKHATKAAVARLCANSAALTSYDPVGVYRLAGLAVCKDTAARDLLVRLVLCWEAHEINFRCEVMALDALMVPRHDWPIMHRWAREARISAIWGPPSSLVTVIPDVPSDMSRPWWFRSSDPRWLEGEPRLRAFVEVMSTWPGCPELLLAQLAISPWNHEQYEDVQNEAVVYYVQTFVSKYHRLPMVPIDYPLDYDPADFPDLHEM